MDTPRISVDDFMREHPPGRRRESVLSAHKKEIFLLRRKGYTIPEIVTFFELVVGKKVSRFAIRDYLSSQTMKKTKSAPSTNQEATKADPKGVSRHDKHPTGNEKSADPPVTLPRTSKQQKREDLASKFDI